MFKSFFSRPQSATTVPNLILAGIAAATLISILAALDHSSGATILIAAFGASAVLVFTLPVSPLSQPINVLGGHLTSGQCGVLVGKIFGVSWWSLGVAVGLALVVMAALRITHPPAGGNPIAAMLAGSTWTYLVTPILVGAILVVVVGYLHNWLLSRAEKRRTSRQPVQQPVDHVRAMP